MLKYGSLSKRKNSWLKEQERKIMKYHFEYDERGRRLFVAELDEELDNIEANDEDVICTRETFRDMTVIFDVDRYINLYRALTEVMKIDREFGKVHIAATIRSVSGSFEFAMMGCSVEIYWYGCLQVTAQWFWNNTLIDFSVVLVFPPEFYADPAVWFEREITEKGIKNHDGNGV